MFGNSFCFLFSKTLFWEYKKKILVFLKSKICLVSGNLKKKKMFFKEKIENTKICCY